MGKNNKLYNYTFHFNSYSENWAAIPRGSEKEYFNDMKARVNSKILFAKDISTLIEFLSK